MIEVKFADLLKEDVDAIVNPANSYMLHGGGLALAIAAAAGPDLVRASRAHVPIKTGDAIATTAGRLPFKTVVHVVGPVWEASDSNPYWKKNSTDENPDELLARAHVSALICAATLRCESVAFPAVSCGVFRFPVERAAPIAVRATREGMEKTGIKRVVFCLMDDRHLRAFSDALEEEEKPHDLS